MPAFPVLDMAWGRVRTGGPTGVCGSPCGSGGSVVRTVPGVPVRGTASAGLLARKGPLRGSRLWVHTVIFFFFK